MNSLEEGMRVVGIRGALVGIIRQISTEALLVEPEDGRKAFWLRMEAVIGVDGNLVELICDTSEVGRYLVSDADEEPGAFTSL